VPPPTFLSCAHPPAELRSFGSIFIEGYANQFKHYFVYTILFFFAYFGKPAGLTVINVDECRNNEVLAEIFTPEWDGYPVIYY